jgi:hypothetical protein
VSAHAPVCRSPSSALLLIDDYDILHTRLGPDEASLALVSLAKVFIWALCARRIRLAALSPPSLPLHHSAAGIFLDTAASGNTVIFSNRRFRYRLPFLVRGTNRSRLVLPPFTGPNLACPGPFSWRFVSRPSEQPPLRLAPHTVLGRQRSIRRLQKQVVVSKQFSERPTGLCCPWRLSMRLTV